MATEILLSNITTIVSDSSFSYGDKKKGAGYHKNNDGVHTAVYDLNGFVGTVKIQGTLATYPGDEDWIDIIDTEANSGDPINNFSCTFTGKFVWIRAAHNLHAGSITEIRYNY